MQQAITSGDPNSHRHHAALDGMRGVAVLGVIYFHMHVLLMWRKLPLAEFGWVGVDLFFCLSGFLLTGVLLKARGTTNYFRVFYARRALRIFPLYYAAVAIVFSIRAWYHQPLAPGVQIWFWLNLSNWVTALHPLLVPQLTHFWTLAIEEQFYFLWPILVLKLRDRALLGVALLTVPLELALRLLPAVARIDALARVSGNFSYRLTPLHSEGLFLGSALAICLHRQILTPSNLVTLRRWAVVLTALPLVLIAMPAVDHPSLVAFRSTALAVVFTLWIAVLVLESGKGFASRILGSRVLRTLGRYSFCMYVVQIGVLDLAAPFVRKALPYPVLLFYLSLALAAIVAVSALSWKLFESPILGLKRFFLYQRAS